MYARFLGPTFAGLLALLAAGALAQTSPPTGAAAPAASPAPAPVTRIRGTIDKVSDHELIVHSRDGSTVNITLMDPLTVNTLKRVPLSAIQDDT
jgi:hypothetical protein